MEHGLQCFARLVRILLGPEAVAPAKLECGPQLCILGVLIRLSNKGYTCQPSADKVCRWLAIIDDVLEESKLPPSDAGKLAGKLAWGCSHMFRRFGRAMLRPIFDQNSRRDGRIDAQLGRALLWWRTVLESDLVEVKEWQPAQTSPVHLFCDASGKPPHLDAVLLADGKCLWTHSAPSPAVMSQFTQRMDNQIMGLELLAIS